MPLDDVRVLDLTRYTAGPFCTRVLGDYGADVIKIEQPGSGDPARSLPPFFKDEPGIERSGLFLLLNTNKRSVTLDLQSERGRELLLALAERAQVVVENFRPGTLDRLGIGYETLREANPELVLTSISNFGQDGPYRDWEGTDLTLLAMGNMIGAGDVDHEPVKTAGHHATQHAGYVAALATAMGLHSAELRGEGEHLDVSIFEAHTHSIDLRLGRTLSYQYNGRLAGRAGVSGAVGSGIFPCADGYFQINTGPALVSRALTMIGREDLLSHPDWSSVQQLAQPERIAEFTAIFLPWILERTKAEVRVECERFGVLGGPLNTIADLLADENFIERGFFQEIDHPTTGPIRYPGYHATLHRPGEPMPERTRAPLLGEHTDEVLGGELGLDAAELAELRASGVI
jgi:crotonobetainyl-CoA:carnitine CoA-transferase CaiB-like acyl-CoA transferase